MTSKEDKARLIGEMSAVMDALASVTGQHLEIVLHDLTQPASSVVKIINGHISGRKPGSPLQSAPENDLGFLGLLEQEPAGENPQVFKDYRTTSARGAALQSSTVMFRDENHQPLISLCFNADHAAVETARALLGQLLPASAPAGDVSSLETRMNEIIRSAMPPSGISGASKKEKTEIVRVMQDKGLFIVRGGVEKAAKALGVTRYTIYNYLDEIKKS
ncbi:transcriptional regulator [Erwinia sp. 198]|uniref:helix-turn-helix transcriptional regulator n=1 Tax=Erwinia sp. 198 TaxID=2022746 RepID=UPI001315660A|nr:PAS domain-containing protein [Erwinia sp. 198]